MKPAILFAATALALAWAAVYASGVLFLLLSKADPRQANWASIFSYWQFYAGDAMLRQRLLYHMPLQLVNGLLKCNGRVVLYRVI